MTTKISQLAITQGFGWIGEAQFNREAANATGLRNGATAQGFYVFNTFTDASNYERAVFDWGLSANVLSIGTANAGTGTARNVRFLVGGVSKADFGISNAAWTFQGGVVAAASMTTSGFMGTSAPTTASGTTYTAAATDSAVIFTNAATCTFTFPAAASFPGRMLRVKTTGGGSVVSASSNVVAKAGGAAATALLGATAGTWAELQSDGANWIVMAGT